MIMDSIKTVDKNNFLKNLLEKANLSKLSGEILRVAEFSKILEG